MSGYKGEFVGGTTPSATTRTSSRSTIAETPSPAAVDLTKGGSGQKYLLRWNLFGEQIRRAFSELYYSNELVDVTLACDGELFKAHRVKSNQITN